MIDLCLRADTEADLIDALPFARGEGEDGEPRWLTNGEGFALDLIGPLTIEPGTYDEDGTEITPPVVADGFHANLRCTEAVAATVPETIIVTPANPRRVWF